LKKMAMEISAETVMGKYRGKQERPRYLMEIFVEHKRKMEAMIGKGYAKNTLKTYKSSVKHLAGYLAKDYKKTDIDIRKIDHAFIVGYEFFLRTSKSIGEVSAAKYIK